MALTAFDFSGGDKVAWTAATDPIATPNQFTTHSDMNALKAKLNQIIVVLNGIPSYLHQSTFQGTDGTSISAYTPIAGNGFSVLGGGMAITGNKMAVKSVTNGTAQAITNVGQGDFTAAVTFEITSNIHHLSLPFRYQDANNQFVVSVEYDMNRLRIFKVLNGVFSVAYDQAVTLNATGSQKVEIITNNSAVSIKYQNNVVLSYTDSDMTNNTKVGIGVAMDNNPTGFVIDAVKFLSFLVV